MTSLIFCLPPSFRQRASALMLYYGRTAQSLLLEFFSSAAFSLFGFSEALRARSFGSFAVVREQASIPLLSQYYFSPPFPLPLLQNSPAEALCAPAQSRPSYLGRPKYALSFFHISRTCVTFFWVPRRAWNKKTFLVLFFRIQQLPTCCY